MSSIQYSLLLSMQSHTYIYKNLFMFIITFGAGAVGAGATLQ
jgi:hypothetical protein